MGEFKEFVKTHKNALILNIVMAVICYGHMAFSLNVGVDTEHVIYAPGSTSGWEAIGRHGLLFTRRLLGLWVFNPYFTGVLFLLFFILSGSMIAFFCWYISGKNERYPYGLFLVLYTTCTIWMGQYYFFLQRVEVTFGMLCAIFSVFFMVQVVFYGKRRWRYLPWLVLGIWSFCSYQANVLLYIGLCIVAFLLDYMEHCHEKSWKEYLWIIVKLFVGFLVVYAANSVITSIFYESGSYLSEQIRWQDESVMEGLYHIAGNIATVLIWRKEEYTSALPVAVVFLCLMVLTHFRDKAVRFGNKLVLLLGLAGLLATPFLLTIYQGQAPPVRSQYVLALTAAFGCTFVYGLWKEREEWRYRVGCWILIGASVVVMWNCVGNNLRMQYTDDVRYREDVAVAYHIASDLNHTEGAQGLPVIFIGHRDARLNPACREVDMYGASFFEWDHEDGPEAGTWRIVGFMRTLGIELREADDVSAEAVALSGDMKCYPESGYISVQNGYVIIKLSEYMTDLE